MTQSNLQTDIQVSGDVSAAMLHPRVLELLASRICHDLVSPVGAVNNGIELMREMDADMADDALDLIESSIGQAAARLKLFRLAYGAAGSEALAGFQDVKATFEGWVSASRTSVNWNGRTDFSDMPKGFAKVLLNVLVLAEECNPGDSRLDVYIDEDAVAASVHALGKRPALHAGMEECLKMDFAVDSIDARLVHAYVTGAFMKHFGMTLSLRQISETELSFRIEAA
jgi:histidine phosphotransferase ChpT|tara:strand:- start:1844 stop:2524 length:681 start_codon:yes stop_codon:yes gene_type:complete